MRFELPAFNALKEMPDHMKELWRYTGLTIDALTKMFGNGITVKENLNYFLYAGAVNDGTTKIFHGLKRVPTAAIVTSGRVVWSRVIGLDANSVSLSSRLLSTTGFSSVGSRGRLGTILETQDARYFLPGDTVISGDTTNQVVSVGQSSLTLAQSVVDRGAGIEIRLAQDTSQVLIL